MSSLFPARAGPLVRPKTQRDGSPNPVPMATYVLDARFGRGSTLEPPIFPVVQMCNRAGFGNSTTATRTALEDFSRPHLPSRYGNVTAPTLVRTITSPGYVPCNLAVTTFMVWPAPCCYCTEELLVWYRAALPKSRSSGSKKT